MNELISQLERVHELPKITVKGNGLCTCVCFSKMRVYSLRQIFKRDLRIKNLASLQRFNTVSRISPNYYTAEMYFCLHVVFEMKQNWSHHCYLCIFRSCGSKTTKECTPTGSLPVLASCPNPSLNSSTSCFSSYGVLQTKKKIFFLVPPILKVEAYNKVLSIKILVILKKCW